MGLLSIFQRKKQTAAKPAKSRAKSPVRQAPPANPADTAEAVRDARARARRRLMGATVLLLVGVIGFPLLFETQPRPIPVDLPIEIPARNGATVVDAPAMPPLHPKGPSSAAMALAATAASAGASAASSAVESVTYDTRPETAATVPASAGQGGGGAPARNSLASALTPGALHGGETASGAQAAAYVKPKPSRTVAQAASAALPARPTPIAHAQPVLPPPPAKPSAGNGASGDAAAALLAGKPVPKASETSPESARFVVQIGAFADDAKMHEARGRVEKLGFKTYTQAVDTPSGKRVRVRVGPYPSKAEADKAAARIKADGMPAAVLSL